MEGETIKIVKLKAIEATPETFKDYGQVIQASADGEEFGPHDAQLHLSRGTPRSIFSLPLPLYVGFLGFCCFFIPAYFLFI